VIVLDTHAWVWWTFDPRRLSARARALLEDAEAIGVPTVSCFEVAALVEGGRIELDRPVRTWVRHALALERVASLPLTHEIAVEAGLLDRRRFPGDPLDGLVYATARVHSAPLVTKDRRIRDFDRASTVW
jgi:PIN domain nuclease of toxin-antitoxin system